MKTKKITLWYTIDMEGNIYPPAKEVVEKKDMWLKEVRNQAIGQATTIVVANEYRMANPEVEQVRKFFNGPVVEYYGIQNDDLFEGELTPARHKQYRKQILDELLGFNVELVDRTIRERKSTSDYTETQQWTDLIEEAKETLFEPNGYEIPESKTFWELSKQIGYDQAHTVLIKKLQDKLKAKQPVTKGKIVIKKQTMLASAGTKKRNTGITI